MGMIFVAGTYGVGKSTLCNKLSTALKIPDFSAGDLISAVNGETYGANKVVRDKDANQNILASQVKQLLKSTGVSLLAFEVYAFYIKSVARSFYSQLLLLWIPMRTKFPLCFLSAFFLMLFLIPFI